MRIRGRPSLWWPRRHRLMWSVLGVVSVAVLLLALILRPHQSDSDLGDATVSSMDGGIPGTLADPPPSGYPDESSTGPSDDVSLNEYTGPCVITTDNTLIEAKTVRCKLIVEARNVTILDSIVLGAISVMEGGRASLTIEDSEVNASQAQEPAVGLQNLTMRRTEVEGGQQSVLCHTDCIIEDSWLHGQFIPPDGDWHLEAFLSTGGSNVVLRHNTLACDAESTSVGGGCTANAAIFGDFGPNSYYTFDSNLFVASPFMSYCVYAGLDPGKAFGADVDHIVFTNNVFQRGDNGRCGLYGPATSFDPSAPGNLWINNVWDDGPPVLP